MGEMSSGACRTRTVILLLAFFLTTSTFAATVTTDKPDYAPGEIVTITGSAWLPGETVTLLLQESPQTHEDRTLIAVADSLGNFINREFSPEEHDLGVTFTLTATGQTSGFTAQTTFTDSDCGGGNLGHLKLVTVTGTTGACSSVSGGSSGTQSFFVEPGETYTLTFQTMAGFECAGSPILTVTVFGQTTIATLVPGSNPPQYQATVTVPENVCQTSPIRYSCGGSEFFVRRTNERCFQAHLSAATFGPGCTNPDPLNSGDVCRPSAGACDVAEVCGSSGLCPADSFAAPLTVCRAATDVCDAAEVCTGASAECPPDVFQPATTVCREAGGVCDAAESCTGASAACPADDKQPAGTVCRESGGVCDPAETCDGSTNSCPADALADSATICRPANGACDQAEACTGASVDCPADAFSSGNVCRASAGVCDLEEICDGTSAACPDDAFAPATTECRAADGICDVAESCTGTAAACPSDLKQPADFVCRPSAGVCDPAETCDGSTNACPDDQLSDASTVCRPAAGVCDVSESCSGTSPACPDDAFRSNVVCRESAGLCDVEESCDGLSAECPANAFEPPTTVCRAAAGACDEQETCTGANAACPDDALKPAGFECRASAGECDISEACSGVDVTCPADAKRPAGTACSPDDNFCTLDQCDGTSDACQHPAGNEGVACDDDSACTIGDVCQGGVCTGEPAPVKVTGGGQFIDGSQKWSFGFNFRGTIAGTSSGHFNAVNHTTGLHINGPVVAILCDAEQGCGPNGVTFLVRDRRSGCIYRVTVEDNAEPGAGADRIQIQRMPSDQEDPLASCAAMASGCDSLSTGNIQRHPPN